MWRLNTPDWTVFLGRIRALVPAARFHDFQENRICEELGELSGFKYFFEGMLVHLDRFADLVVGRMGVALADRSNDARPLCALAAFFFRRVIGTLSNMPEFQAAFHCAASEKMVRANRCQIW
jgi:hypothetical protein